MEIHLQNLTVLPGLLEENQTLQNLLNNAENVFSVMRAMTADWEGVYRGFHGMLKSIDKAALESNEENIPPQDKTDAKESPDDLEQVKFNLPSFFSSHIQTKASTCAIFRISANLYFRVVIRGCSFLFRKI
jgi:hypothetical protein